MVIPVQTMIAEGLEEVAFGYGVAALATSGDLARFVYAKYSLVRLMIVLN